MSGDTGNDWSCGCSVSLIPCETHRTSMENGDERAFIEVQYHDKYSHWAKNCHSVDLERVQRIELGLDDEPMEFDERSLAAIVQKVADDRPYELGAFILRAIANALRGEDANHKLVLRQTRRGTWKSPADRRAKGRQQLAWIIRLDRLRAEGWPTDAAIHRIAETTGNSDSTIYAGIAQQKAWQKEILSLRAILNFARKHRSKAKDPPS